MFEGRTVFHTLSSNRLAGTERHVIALSHAQRELGCDARLVCRTDARIVAEAARERNIPVHGPWSFIGRKAAVIHAHDGQAALASVSLGRCGGSAIVRTQHFMRPASANRSGPAGRLSLHTHRLINSRCRGQIMVSQSVLAFAREREDLGAAHVTVIPSGIELPSRGNAEEAMIWRQAHPNPVLVAAGRLEPERRLDVLVRAMPAVLERFPESRLIIAGDGSAANGLRALAQSLAIDEAIEWTGWVPDLGAILRRAHTYINTWPFEAFGMATAEAMSYGLAPVVPNAGAARELIEPDHSGMEFNSDDPGALADVLTGLLSDPSQIAEIGTRAEERARAYDIERVAAQTLGFYSLLVD